jgi:hypothetical protein
MKYIVNTEPLGTDGSAVYGQMLTAMTNAGFSSYVTSENGQAFVLPLSTFIIDTSSSLNDVLALVRETVSAQGHSAAVFVAAIIDCSDPEYILGNKVRN